MYMKLTFTQKQYESDYGMITYVGSIITFFTYNII